MCKLNIVVDPGSDWLDPDLTFRPRHKKTQKKTVNQNIRCMCIVEQFFIYKKKSG